MAVSEKQERKIQGLLRCLSEYLTARFEQAARINPSLRRVQNDLVWLELASVRQVFATLKGFGPDRIAVVDVLLSFDDKKKDSLYTLTNQSTIYNQIVTEEEEKKETMEGRGIRDLTSFYKMLEPGLERIITLVQTWIWWDLKDAVDLHLIDLQADKIRALSRAQMTPEIAEYYRIEMQEAPKDLSIGHALAFEFQRAKRAAAAFEHRRDTDPQHKIILKRDRINDEELDAQTEQLTRCLREVEQVRKADELQPETREEYAIVFACPPDQVSKQRVLDRVQENLAAQRAKLRAMLDSEESWGEPYDFKEKQGDMVREKMARMEETARAASSLPKPAAEPAKVAQ